MAETFPDSVAASAHGDSSVLDQIRREWEQKYGQFGPGKNPMRWREARALYPIVLPPDGWYIDISHADSIAALNRSSGPLGGPFHPTQRVTLANLTGEDRAWTCRVATLLRSVVLDDGSLPHGIQFVSKHGTNGLLWASWLRAIDDGKPEASEGVRALAGREIEHPSKDPALKAAADALGLCLF